MGREQNAKLVQILYIGRPDPLYEKLSDHLQREGIATEYVVTQKAGLEKAVQLQPQLIIVNPSNSSFSAQNLCRTLGRKLPNARRLVMMERLIDDVACEQHLLRPFTVRKLRDTLVAMLREAAPQIVRAGPIQLDLITKCVDGPAGHHHLTPKQSSLLATFMRKPNQVISRKDLMDLIWDTEYLGDTRTLDVHIRWLREKIELDAKHPAFLITRRGIGYVLTVPELVTSVDTSDELELVETD